MLGLTTTEDIRTYRKNICDSCENKKVIVGIEYCGVCKCAILMKIATKSAHCPQGKWEQDI